ncbi:TRAP transporter large permease [Mameliella alba]|nr:TRAP transporter large permease [Antarctobacter heliothermus]MBY6144447.1 TRAP transporter large permease [Mameliella alba]MBY6163509.1 TRAP transporter large permease [Mameliella alba]MBY6171772.1 TRAP transporter large permease [Mameliella alba]MBY6176997.1 TRAP transporter large permease [Mameliella alba]
MSGELIALLAFGALFGLMILRVPIGIAMIMVGFGGFGTMIAFDPALNILGQAPIRTATDEVFGVIPLFILMGTFATNSGLSQELYKASHAWVGHRRGGLALATIFASGGFAAICGSSVASAATLGKVALPEMLRYGYRPSFASGTIASGGTLGILIPPSIVLAVYGILTEQDIARLFIAGLVPGLLAIALYAGVIAVLTRLKPEIAPASGQFDLREAIRSLAGIWAVVLLFVFVIGGIYVGFFTPTEAAAMGAGGTLIIGILRGRLTLSSTLASLKEATRLTGAIFIIAIGAVIFGYFLTVTRAPQNFANYVGDLPWSPGTVLLIIILGYVVLGMFLDSLAIILLTVPIMLPVIRELGYDPIWFGILLVMVVEIGLISPPYGMNVFVLKSVAPDLRLGEIYAGVTPFIAVDMIRVILIVLFPIIVLYLPNSM